MDWITRLCRRRIVVFDGGLGTALQAQGVPAGTCNEVLVETQPDIVRSVHEQFLAAGADVIETDSFGGAWHTLAEHGLGERCFALNRKAAEIARGAARDCSTRSWPRFVAGSIGPGSKLPSLGHIAFADLVASYRPQVDGLLAGGVDCLILETSQDLLQLKAALAAALDAFESGGRNVPVIAQVTLNEHGRTLTGSGIETVLAAIEPYRVAAIGLNCGLGPDGLTAAARYLASHSSRLVSVMPNAGLPRVEAGRTVYDLSPEEFAASMKQLAAGPGLAIAGGCCGTTPEHIRHLKDALEGVAPRQPVRPVPCVSSLFSAQKLRVNPRPLFVGERTNASGSRCFRELLLARDFDAMVAAAQEQKSEGAQVMDLSVAAAGSDEVADVKELAVRLNASVDIPVMVDSTRYEAVEAALERLGGRCIVNSINLEDPERAEKTIRLCRRTGAALVLMTIDGRGMAMTCERKLDVAERLYDLAVRRGGLLPQDVLFDFLTFTLASGEESLRNAGVETLKAIREAKRRFPESFTLLGVSNISHGLAPQLRRALNTVFLLHAVEHGLDAAILHAGRIEPLAALGPELVDCCEDLIFNRSRGKATPLEALLALGVPATAETKPQARAGSPSARDCVLAGDRTGIVRVVGERLKTRLATEIITRELLPAMDEVGRRFESGKMQLPFVLRSAEAVRAALDVLRAYLPAGSHRRRGTLLLATVRGDVHDIGKNLVDMIVSSNGFNVINLGVRQTPEDIIAAAHEHQPDAIGLSGLLVESARAMKEYLEAFADVGLTTPVICGGAALTRAFVDKELQPQYSGKVHYAKDALEGLRIIQTVTRAGSSRPRASGKKSLRGRTVVGPPPTPGEAAMWNQPRIVGAYVRALTKIVHADVRTYAKLLDRDQLFRRRWRMLGPRPTKAARLEAEGLLDRLLAAGHRRGLWHGVMVYGMFEAGISGSELVVVHPRTGQELTRLEFAPAFTRRLQRRHGTGRLHVALQVVTTGERAVEQARKLAGLKRIRDQFLLHGLTAELTEVLAVYCQSRLPRLPGWKKTIRYSPGYPVWPDLSEQKKIFALLRPERIGVTLTRSFQMVPEYSTSAIVLPA
ncbi:homocysteine S-methyltransferase family protein [candidate division WOR-3 bacterium]|nr:homocysteine S-methyltransferase family protein [candidate division WOR-3 bacterium]